MGIKTDTSPAFSCVHNYSLRNKLSCKKIKYKWQNWTRVIDGSDVEFLCFTPHIFLPVIHLLVSACTSWGHEGVSRGIKPRGCSINFSPLHWFTSRWQRAIHDLRKSSIFFFQPPCVSTWLRIHYGRSNQERQRKVRLEGSRLIRTLVYLIRNELE